MRILIKVTKEILEASKMCHYPATENCAIAVATREILPGFLVNHKTINNIEKQIYILLPKEAREFVLAFDDKSPKCRADMSPISFEIEVPDSYIDSIGIEEVKDILSGSKTLELVNN